MMTSIRITLVLTLQIFVVMAVQAAQTTDAQRWAQQLSFPAPGDRSVRGDVVIDGNTALIISNSDVYAFVRGEDGKWAQQAELKRDLESWIDDHKSGYHFSTNSMALSGGTVLIGGMDLENSGFLSLGTQASYVYVRRDNGTWIEQAKLTGNDMRRSLLGSTRVAIDGDTALTGVVERGRLDQKSLGTVQVFVRAKDGKWTQQAELIPDDSTESKFFGSTMALSGDTALIGAGYVFVREKDGTWKQQAKLQGPAVDGPTEVSVALEGDTALVSFNKETVSSPGWVDVFVRDASRTWNKQAQLKPESGNGNINYGDTVSLSGGTALIGTSGKKNKRSKYADVFVRGENGVWNRQTTLGIDLLATGSVALSGKTGIVVGDRTISQRVAQLAVMRASDPTINPDDFPVGDVIYFFNLGEN